ncbi:MAG: hypothetical protein QGG26_07530 [Candidatus Undinarchaeales archaeon]|jgi:hypothetical protein|nr:hypothetical protein [Candidatus Undinarchaeales archaeon]
MAMSHTAIILAIIVTAALVLVTIPTWPANGLDAPPATIHLADNGELESGIALTLYDDGLALVRDRRTIPLKANINEVRFRDISSFMDPTSVHFSSISAPGTFMVQDQAFRHDLATTEALLERSVGNNVTIHANGEVLTGRLMSANGKYLALEGTDDELTLVARNDVGRMTFSTDAGAIISSPALVLRLRNGQEGEHLTELTYSTTGLSWKGEYVAIVNEGDDGTTVDLATWASIDNQCGAAFTNARINLVHTEGAPTESASEYHVYELPRTVTLPALMTRQVALAGTDDVRATTGYLYDHTISPGKVGAMVEFSNNEESGLGSPLPPGRVRIYIIKEDGSLHYLNEHALFHTPRNEAIRFLVRNEPDIRVERTVPESMNLTETAFRESYHIKFINQKYTEVAVSVVEHHSGDWSVVTSDRTYDKKPKAVEFSIPVPNRGEAELTYTVMYRR